ncbi:MAG: M55 family metallopeptidase [Pseudomonadales bacterium]
MKVYISADIEGVAGITHWDEARKNHSDHSVYCQQMTREVVAACEGAVRAGAIEITVKDAHGSGRNLIANELPDCVKLVRGWSGHPLCMVQELDASYDAVMMVGYHAKAGDEGNPLAHSLALRVDTLEINGVPASEFTVHYYAALMLGVPTVMLSGDSTICRDVTQFNSHIQTVSVSEGVGASTISISPSLACKQIESAATHALQGDLAVCKVAMPEHFEVRICYNEPVSAYRAAFYPGVSHIADRTVAFASRDYFEVLRLLAFVT